MKITYSKPVNQECELNIDESDLASLNDIVRGMALDRLRVVGLHTPTSETENSAVDLCRKYGVDPGCKQEVFNFYSALLGV